MTLFRLQAKIFPAWVALGMSIALPHFVMPIKADVVSHTQETQHDNSPESPETQRMMRLIRIANGAPALSRFENHTLEDHPQATALTSGDTWFEEWDDDLPKDKAVPNIPEPAYFVFAGAFLLFALSTRRKRSVAV